MTTERVLNDCRHGSSLGFRRDKAQASQIVRPVEGIGQGAE